MIALLLISFLVLLFIGMPVAYAMACAAGLAIVAAPSLPSLVIGQKMFTAMDSFSLMAIPFFMLAGSIMNETGITKKIVDFARSFVGHLTGGLGHTAIVTGVLMAGISGSANADASAIASMLVPALKEEGYDDGYACAMISGCGALGPVIPPSIMMVIYSGVISISISALFLAGVIPGLLIGGGYMAVNFLYARKNHIPRQKFMGFRNILRSLGGAIWALIMPAIIIGGILSGVVTATESGVLAVAYGVLYGFLSKNLDGKKLKKCLLESVQATTNPMMIMAFAALFGYAVTYYNFAKVIADCMIGFTSSGIVALLVISVILFIAGMFIDSNAALLMLVPIFSPLIALFGFHPIHFAMVCILTLVMGGMSPPAGLLMYITASCTNTPLEKVVRHIWPFLAANYVIVLAVILFPALVTWLPGLAG